MAATSRGIDVSSYQGAQDWAALARGGLTYAAAKASEGERSHDEHYRMHMDGILSVASLLPQAYHYAWPNQDPRAEADNYLAAVEADADRHPGFVHWLDLERRTDGANYAGRSGAQIRAWAEAWIDRVKAAHPRQRVGCYTSGSDITAGRYPRNSEALWYPAYPSGAMSYTAAEQRTRPAPSGVKALFWQFTSTPVDRSIAYMTPAALRAWAGAPSLAPEADPMAGMTKQDIFDAVWQGGGIAAPDSAPDRKAHPTWWPGSYLRDIQGQLLTLRQQLAAQTAAISTLAAKVGKDDEDTATIVAAVEDAIARAVVRVEVVDGDPATAPAAPVQD